MISHHAVLLSVEAPLSYNKEEWSDIPETNRYRLPQVGIDDVRTLISDAYRRPGGQATVQTLIVATEFITVEAQQALLKIIEEPPVSTHFIFVIPAGYTFLPTLESRFSRVGAVENVTMSEAFEAFRDSDYRTRMELIDEHIKRKDHAWYQEIKNGLSAYLRKEGAALNSGTLRDLEYVLRHLLTRGASNKFLMEQLALTLPA